VRAAISRDGRTIAVMHSEEFCDTAPGCTPAPTRSRRC
jgi:hypothetical protein